MTEKELILDNLNRLADVIVRTFGRNCEVAVHDFGDLRHSLVHIAGSVTKRRPGAPITDLVVKAWRKEGNAVTDIANYQTNTKEGRILKSSTFFIRNKKGAVIGAVCINFDITDFLNSVALVENFVSTDTLKELYISETFASSLNETIDSLIEQAVGEIGKQLPTMSKDERIRVVALLEEKGAFLIKGGVDHVALKMGVSKYTIYHYLRNVRAAQNLNVA
jgi:predicted transcriptional regulator YheO